MQGVTPHNRHVKSLAQEFLRVHWDQKRPLLLGYSGGPDSKALLYALLDCGVSPHIVHVDHGWRSESQGEAKSLKKEVEALGLPFFSTRLDVAKTEDAARKGRYKFFSSLFSDAYQALLLAHTADDLAETVLKRIFEGAHLANLSGMQPISTQHSMTIWRPLLNCKRAAILEYLEEKSLTAIHDPTNLNPIYLRARMRREMFPHLTKWFGKEILENINLLSSRSYELKKYLDNKVVNISVQKGPWGMLVDLNGLETLEKQHILCKMGKELSITISRKVLETILNWVDLGEKSKTISVGKRKILVDKGRVWFEPG